jgi:hypothetical protein
MPRYLHVRCLACHHDAAISPWMLKDKPVPPPGRTGRFRCRCGARDAWVTHEERRPNLNNPCGWL